MVKQALNSILRGYTGNSGTQSCYHVCCVEMLELDLNFSCTKYIFQAILNLALQKEYCSNTFVNDSQIHNCDGYISKDVDLVDFFF